ncbi:GAF domain-containing protein, partial [bacterium]
VPNYGIEIYPWAYLSTLGWLSCMGWATFKYRLMDIKIALTRTGIFIAVYTLVLGIPFATAGWLRPWLSAVIGVNWWVAPFSLMALLATTGPFIYIYLNRKAEEKLLKEQKAYQGILRNASLEMTRLKDMKVLLEFIVHITTGAVRMHYAAIYLLDRDNSYYKLESIRAREGKAGLSPRIEMNCALVKWLSDKKEPLVAEEIKRYLQDHPQKDLEQLKNQLELMNIALIVPSFVENKLLAFMALGDKSSGEIYTPDDLHVFTVLASQAALAIENARFLEDAREMQEQISQAEKMATIGTMADGLSHQINNRFHALSLIAGDTLDTINLADTGQYAPEQKGLLGQVRHGLERILANVVQGGEVVKGMLKYSRKGEEGFSAVSLDKVIDSTLEMVQYKIKLNRVDIVRDYPKDAPAIQGNLTQLQEVFFNLIDNAYDAMMERQEAFKEDSYRPKIRIYTEDTHNGTIRIKVEDNGMGVRPEDAGKMFTPFFTTKVSSRKGTGLGLYVIKKIVAANHQGKISVESNYRQGTTFILDLPLYKGKEE